MERRDYLMREIEKLIALIKKILGIVEGLDFDNFEESIQKIDNDLETQFGFNLAAIINMSKSEYLSEIKKIDELNTELFIDFLSNLSTKINHLQKNNLYKSEELAKKAIVTVDYLDEKTKTFSYKRMELKKKLLSQDN